MGIGKMMYNFFDVGDTTKHDERIAALPDRLIKLPEEAREQRLKTFGRRLLNHVNLIKTVEGVDACERASRNYTNRLEETIKKLEIYDGIHDNELSQHCLNHATYMAKLFALRSAELKGNVFQIATKDGVPRDISLNEDQMSGDIAEVRKDINSGKKRPSESDNTPSL